MLNKLILWIRLSPSANYWYIRLKVNMIATRAMKVQLIGKEEEFKDFGRLFQLCWMQVMMLSGTMFHLVGCFHHWCRSYCIQHDLRWMSKLITPYWSILVDSARGSRIPMVIGETVDVDNVEYLLFLIRMNEDGVRGWSIFSWGADSFYFLSVQNFVGKQRDDGWFGKGSRFSIVHNDEWRWCRGMKHNFIRGLVEYSHPIFCMYRTFVVTTRRLMWKTKHIFYFWQGWVTMVSGDEAEFHEGIKRVVSLCFSYVHDFSGLRWDGWCGLWW